MKIGSPIHPASIVPVNGRSKPVENMRNAEKASNTEEVSLSTLSGQFQPGELQAPVNSARVAEIKEAITQGRFTINTGAIADRLIDTARELINSQRRA